jgi:hypothetical protein
VLNQLLPKLPNLNPPPPEVKPHPSHDSNPPARQLRDDLLSMLVAGHETTGSALTWTLYLLATNPQTMARVQVG